MQAAAEVVDLGLIQQIDAPVVAVLHEIRAVRELFERIEKRLTGSATQPQPQGERRILSDETIVDQRTAPVPRDLYLRLAREGRFPSKKIGKRVVANWGDVKAAFLGPGIRKARNANAGNDSTPDGLDDLRRQLGLAQRGK